MYNKVIFFIEKFIYLRCVKITSNSNRENMHDDFDNQSVSGAKLRNLPIYLKGKEIVGLVKDITDLIDDEDQYLGVLKHDMLSDAYSLCAKIAGAEGGGLYAIRMECAAIIRKSAIDLDLNIHKLKMFNFEHADYYKMVCIKVEEFRLLFIEWVQGFDKKHYAVDRWGLFNPPGVGPFDNEEHNNDADDTDHWFDGLFEDDDD